MIEQTKTRFPAPLYAAAGAGDLAYQQLRKLPAVVNELSDRATASLKAANEQASTTATTLRDRATTTDFDKLRDTATHSAVAFAQIASERAIALYTALVARLRGFGSESATAASTAFGSSVVTMSALTTSAASTTPVPTTRSPRATRAV